MKDHSSYFSGKKNGWWGTGGDTSLHCVNMDMGLVHCIEYLFTPQLLLQLISPTHRGMARLS